MAAAAIAVHLPKHSSIPPKPIFSSEKNSNFLGGFLYLRRPVSLNREINKGPPVMVSASSTSKTVVTDDVDGDRSKRFYVNFTGFPFPLGPFLNRRTIRTEDKHHILFFLVLTQKQQSCNNLSNRMDGVMKVPEEEI